MPLHARSVPLQGVQIVSNGTNLSKAKFPTVITNLTNTISGFSELTASKVGSGQRSDSISDYYVDWDLDWQATTSGLVDINTDYQWTLRHLFQGIMPGDHLINFIADPNKTYTEKYNEARLCRWIIPEPTITYDVIHDVEINTPVHSRRINGQTDTTCQGFSFDDVTTVEEQFSFEFPLSPNLINAIFTMPTSITDIELPTMCRPYESGFLLFTTPFRQNPVFGQPPPPPIPEHGVKLGNIVNYNPNREIQALTCDEITTSYIDYFAIPLVDDVSSHTRNSNGIFSSETYTISQSYTGFRVDQNRTNVTLEP